MDAKPTIIHDIPDSLAEEMRARLVPVFFDNDNGQGLASTFRNMKGITLKKTAYTWAENAKKPIGWLTGMGAVPIMTFHRWNFYGFFKPSFYEVYCGIYQAFGDDWRKVKYFWLDSSDKGFEVVLGDYHYCKCLLWAEEDLRLEMNVLKNGKIKKEVVNG